MVKHWNRWLKFIIWVINIYAMGSVEIEVNRQVGGEQRFLRLGRICKKRTLSV